MGRTIEKEYFFDEDYQRFSLRLLRCLVALRELLERPGFGEGATSIGAELELALVDADTLLVAELALTKDAPPDLREVLARHVDRLRATRP